MALPKGVQRADAITQLLAARVAELRKAAGLNQAELGARMAQLRPGWSRSTVVKLENKNRESVSVADLLALAQALDVPPVILLADPRREEWVPVAEGKEVDPWRALLWMIGRVPMPGTQPEHVTSAWREAAELLLEAHIAMEMVEFFGEPVGPGQSQEANERNYLTVLSKVLQRFNEMGVPQPPLPGHVYLRARQLDVTLPAPIGTSPPPSED